MSERPILFSGPMVRAILDGSKTVTRRVVKPQPSDDYGSIATGTYYPAEVDRHGVEYPGDPAYGAFTNDGYEAWRSPYGAPGYRLWVRETWRGFRNERGSIVQYRASAGEETSSDREYFGRWRPSIHMPRWASRITLEVTDVAVERVQDTTTADILAEGTTVPTDGEGHVLWRLSGRNPAGKVPASYLPHGRLHPGKPPVTQDEILRAHFADLWDSINAKRGHGWDENPWVWVVRFRRVES